MLPASFLRWPGLGLAAVVTCLLAPVQAEDKAPVIVHEWGTFTSLQDQNGQSIGGINVDDEPVPDFVWHIANDTVVPQYSELFHNFGLPPYSGTKAWTVADPAVTMRLETPVLYIYPPTGKSAANVPPLTVHVDFYGGILSQFYPYATTNGMNLNGTAPYVKDPLSGETSTGLTWENVRLVDSGTAVQTDDKVWTAPREVKASLLQVPLPEEFATADPKMTSQTEKFLFYRGVGALDSILQVGHRRTGTVGGLSAQPWDFGGRCWNVEVHPDGSCAFDSGRLTPSLVSMSFLWKSEIAGTFKPSDFRSGNLAKLKTSMHAALVQAGLYPDEATAMLKTWELSYFKSPGLRFFYIAPKTWVDDILPLSVTGAPVKITRVMIGRIELISDEQQAALERLAAGPYLDLPAFKKAAEDALMNSGRFSRSNMTAFWRGDRPLSDLGIPMSPLLQDYLSMGRFRDALIVHENQIHHSPALAQFIEANHLAPQPASTAKN